MPRRRDKFWTSSWSFKKILKEENIEEKYNFQEILEKCKEKARQFLSKDFPKKRFVSISLDYVIHEEEKIISNFLKDKKKVIITNICDYISYSFNHFDYLSGEKNNFHIDLYNYIYFYLENKEEVPLYIFSLRTSLGGENIKAKKYDITINLLRKNKSFLKNFKKKTLVNFKEIKDFATISSRSYLSEFMTLEKIRTFLESYARPSCFSERIMIEEPFINIVRVPISETIIIQTKLIKELYKYLAKKIKLSEIKD